MKEQKSIEQEVIVVDEFFETIVKTGTVPVIDRELLIRVFDNFGVNIGDITAESQASLKVHDLKGSFLALREVWSDARLDSYDVNLANFIMEYNKTHPRRLSRSKDSHSGESGMGMRRFLMYTTQLISNDISFEEYQSNVKDSCKNEVLWKLRRDDERVTESTKSGKSIPVPMMPAEYAVEFWNWVKQSSKTTIDA